MSTAGPVYLAFSHIPSDPDFMHRFVITRHPNMLSYLLFFRVTEVIGIDPGWLRRRLLTRSDQPKLFVDEFALLFEHEHAFAEVLVPKVTPVDWVDVLFSFIAEVDALVVTLCCFLVDVAINPVVLIVDLCH